MSGGKNIRLKVFFAEDEFVCIYANDETDVAEYLDTQLVPRLIKDEKTREEYMGIWGIKNIRWSKKGSDLIPYLRVPYEEAKKNDRFSSRVAYVMLSKMNDYKGFILLYLLWLF